LFDLVDLGINEVGSNGGHHPVFCRVFVIELKPLGNEREWQLLMLGCQRGQREQPNLSEASFVREANR